ncbi:MAG: cache domain-containing protein, partial [Deltaproteobacteria bacterium]|nr:cache domain-containing protein [Deltaproteobacteria bacterium]
MTGNLPYIQLYRTIMLYRVSVSLVPLFVLGGVIYYYFYSSYQTQSQEELRKIAEGRANAIELFLSERTMQLEILTATLSLDDLVKPGRLKEILTLLNSSSKSFVDLGVIDHQGNHAAYSGPYSLENRNYREAAWFQETMFRGLYISDVFLGFRGVPHFVIAVKRDQEPAPWILRATIDSDVFNRLVKVGQT